MSLIIDASVALSWVFEDEVSSMTEAALDAVVATGGRVPGLWTLEILNVLLVGERRGRISVAQGSRFAEHLFALPILIEPAVTSVAAGEVFGLARAHRLSAYDAAYLELSVRTDLPLATKDTALAAAAAKVGVVVFGDGP